MKTLLLFSTTILFIIASCNKNSDDVINSQNTITGGFAGTFQRSGGDTSHVKLLFSPNGVYEGETANPRYPAICGGTYSISGSTITFNDTCNWTADFDWTLILDGTYNFSHLGDSIKIWRTSSGITDEYNLDRMVR